MTKPKRTKPGELGSFRRIREELAWLEWAIFKARDLSVIERHYETYLTALDAWTNSVGLPSSFSSCGQTLEILNTSDEH